MTRTRTSGPFAADGSLGDRSSWSLNQPTDGSFDVAGAAGWMARLAMQVYPEIEPNFRATVRGIVGAEFTPKELQTLQDRALDTVKMEDLTALRGIGAGTPVDLTRARKAAIDRLIQNMGTDPLGRRARDAYGEALKNGDIRVR